MRLSLIRQAGLYAWETLRGIGMIYSLSDWIEENILRIVQHPGRLSDLDGIVSGEETHIPKQPKVERNIITKKRQIDWTPREAIAELSVFSLSNETPRMETS